MKEITFLEKLAENLLEGSFARALKPKLQPVQIAKALTRAMERSQVVGAEGPLVANRYLVYLHPDDLAAVSAFQAGLERELASYLRGYAARQGYRTLASPSVRVLPAEQPGRPGRVRVEASLVDTEPAPASALRQSASPWEGTVVMPAVRPDPTPAPAPPDTPAAPARPGAALVDETGQSFDLAKDDTSVGRAVDNDIVLETRGVSRHHARLVWDSGRYVLIDLGSTNGSYVAGRRVTRHALSGGEEISLGGTRFAFRLVDPEG